MSLGGQGGIRTHGELAPTAVFKTAALNHSATCPFTPRIAQWAADARGCVRQEEGNMGQTVASRFLDAVFKWLDLCEKHRR